MSKKEILLPINQHELLFNNDLSELGYYEILSSDQLPIESFQKLPLSQLAMATTLAEPIITTLQQALTGAESTVRYAKVVIPKGTKLAAYKDGNGYLGTVIDKNGIAGQSRIYPLAINPAVMFMVIAVYSMNQKLSEILQVQQEIIEFLKQKQRSELRGDLTFLADIVRHYKYNFDNEKYKTNHHIKVLDIKQSAEQKIDFYRTRLKKSLKKNRGLALPNTLNKRLNQATEDLHEYQLSLYMYAFSSYLEVMLLENFNEEYLSSIQSKIETYSINYFELYTNCYNLLQQSADQSIDTTIIKGFASLNKFAGETIAKIPGISRSQLDENLIESGEKLHKLSQTRADDKVHQLAQYRNPSVRPFIENIERLNHLYNRKSTLLFDRE